MITENKKNDNTKKISLFYALLPVLFLVASLYYSVQIAELDVHIPILVSALFAALVAKLVGCATWEEMEEGVVKTIKMSMRAILILMIIGTVIGSWIISGIVPTMIFYGLKIIEPSVFLPVTVIICSIVSISTGSSWSTASTVGIALIGVGEGLGLPRPLIAGAIISGAYFGDKLSPMSDTTILAPAMAGATLFEHIKHMLYTTVPTYIISLIVFFVLGLKEAAKGSLNISQINSILDALSQNFVINPFLLLIPVFVIGMVVMRMPAIPGLFIGSLLGTAAAILVQKVPVKEAIYTLHYGYSGDTGLPIVDELLNRGGLDAMMWTVSLILCAMVFGGIMEKSGILGRLAEEILKFANTNGKLILSTLLSTTFVNFVAGDQYMSLVISGRMYREIYKERGLKAKNLSRALEDSGTMTSPLVPWNTCGAFMMGALGLTPWVYVPYCIFNLLSPIVSAIYGFTGFTIEKIEKEDNI
ncbi:MAG: Na+/H+ antiporter NhaC [Fusobacterium sp.]|nr:Na+/H+ antiporter NhaC [Fusobacterium sp.]